MTIEVLQSAVLESVWERARALPDAEAASVLRHHFVSELFPTLPEHELFTVTSVLREIAYLSPQESRECIEWMGRAPQWAGRQVEQYPGRMIAWQEFVSAVCEDVAPWANARTLGRGPEAGRIRQKQRVSRLPAGTEERLREECVYLLAEALTNAANAKDVATEWWRSKGRLRDAHVPRELILRLWRQAPEAAVAWLENGSSTGTLICSGMVPLFLFTRTLSRPEISPLLTERLLTLLPHYGNLWFIVATTRLWERSAKEPGRGLWHVIRTARECLERLEDMPPQWLAEARRVLLPFA